MRRLIGVILGIVLTLPLVLALPHYHYDVQAGGIVHVTITTNETVTLEVPIDVENYRSDETSLSRQGNRLEIDPSGIGTFEYSTTYYTSKRQGIWTFIGAIETPGTATVTLPEGVVIARIEPQGQISTQGRPAVDFADTQNTVVIDYTLPVKNGAVPVSFPVGRIIQGIGGILLIVVLASLVYWYKRRNEKDEKDETPAQHPVKSAALTTRQKDILHAASANEQIVLTHLLTANGIIKRNKLERESGLAKSSLASTLHGLEQKDLITVERKFRVHVIRATDWLKENTHSSE